MKLGEKQVLMMEKEVISAYIWGRSQSMSSYRKSRCQGGWSPEIRWKYFYIKIPGTG